MKFFTTLVSAENAENKKVWQSGFGVGIFFLFVISSVVVNKTVQALNQASGSYGYYGGVYSQFNNSTSSDAPPAVPSGLASSNVSTTSITLSWSAPTRTTANSLIASSTGGAAAGSVASYKVHYSTSAQTACSGGSSTTSTSASVNLTSLSSNQTYNVAVCAVDNNGNTGSPLAGTFTTSSGGGTASGGGGGGGATSVFSTPATTVTTTPTITVVAPTVTTPSVVGDAVKLAEALGVKRDIALETAALKRIDVVLKEVKVTVSALERVILQNFVAYGISSATIALGSGERAAVAKDLLETLGKVSVTALEQISSGKKPTDRNITNERKLVPVALRIFIKLVGHRPNFKNAREDLAWNTLQYRIRFPRNLTDERKGIAKFRQVEKRLPKSALDWAEVRAWGYQLAK